MALLDKAKLSIEPRSADRWLRQDDNDR